MYAIKEINEEEVLRCDYKQKYIYIIHPDFMIDNKEITDQFIKNLKENQTRFTA